MKINNNTVDRSHMRKVIMDFPKQFKQGIYAANNAHIEKTQLRTPIVICGMGGSASVGDLLKLWLRHEYLGFSEFEVIVHRGYGLPKLERRDYGDGTLWEPLIIAISYSGNTEETLSAYQSAREKSLPIVAMSTGGELKKRANADGAMFVEIPNTGIQPRSSFGFQFGAIVGVLSQFNIFSNEPDFVTMIAESLDPGKYEKEGKEIAKKLSGTIPLIYASDAWRELAHIIKIKFNEHAKLPAFWNYFPELNHNEMTGFAEPNAGGKASSKFHICMLEDKNDEKRIQKRMKLTAKMLAKKGIKSTSIALSGKTVLEKIFSTLLLGDWIAYYAAILRNVDPTPVKMVEEFKKLMK